jgi:hypothetical protein
MSHVSHVIHRVFQLAEGASLRMEAATQKELHSQHALEQEMVQNQEQQQEQKKTVEQEEQTQVRFSREQEEPIPWPVAQLAAFVPWDAKITKEIEAAATRARDAQSAANKTPTLGPQSSPVLAPASPAITPAKTTPSASPKIEAVAKKLPPKDWDCGVCTAFNIGARTICEVCEAPRPAPAKAEAPKATAPSPPPAAPKVEEKKGEEKTTTEKTIVQRHAFYPFSNFSLRGVNTSDINLPPQVLLSHNVCIVSFLSSSSPN